jgi:hypothetical protein
MTNVHQHFLEAWEGCDADDIFYVKAIPKTALAPWIAYLREYVSLIQSYPFTRQEWAKFKADCLERCEEDELHNLVLWSAPSLQKERPYVTFDLVWYRLLTPEVCFLTILMIGNTSVAIPRPDNAMYKRCLPQQ